MNHLIVRPEQLSSAGDFTVEGERARHLVEVLKVSVGSSLRAARLNHEAGTAMVTALQSGRVSLRYEPRVATATGLDPGCAAPEDGTDNVLLLAIPRPKVLSRCIQHAAALGYRRIVLFRSYRVEKAHLESAKLAPDRLVADAILGLEQARRVFLPELVVYARFRPFVEDSLSGHVFTQNRYVGHPTAALRTRDLMPPPGNYCVALGPEGGLIDFEIGLLQRAGFHPVSFGPSPLRVESALSYLTGQLDWVHAAR